MKKIVSVSLLLILVLILNTSFIGTDPQRFLKKQGFKFIPSSITDPKKGFYILDTEISNAYYKIFIKDITKRGRTADLLIAAVDTAAWKDVFSEFEPFSNYYYQDESYADYPVVNISYEAAVLYCNWLTEVYREEGYNITISLPDSVQWKTAAKGGKEENIFSWEGSANINNKGFYKCNAKKDEECSYVTAPVYSFEKNNFGLYNICGNVAEMLIEKGYHKGGSWNSNIEFVKVDSKDEYASISKASPFIGFRPVAIINQ